MMLGHALANQHRGRHVHVAPRPKRAKTDALASNQTVQKALAALGLYQGPLTGKLDKLTQAAIASFQSRLGEKPTGKLTDTQRQVLFANYAQRILPIPPADDLSGSRGKDLLALLGAAGAGAAVGAGAAAGAGAVGDTGAAGAGAAAGSAGSAVGAAGFAGGAGNGAAGAAAAAGGTGGSGGKGSSFGAICKEFGAASRAGDGGAVLSASALKLTPGQFCAARDTAIDDAFGLIAQPGGGTNLTGMRKTCGEFVQALNGLGAAARSTPAPAMMARLRKDLGGAMPPTAVGTAKICLGIAYAEDDPDRILANALALVGFGEGGYGEAVGGIFGLGLSSLDNKARSAEWLDLAADQIAAGAAPIVRTVGAERSGVLRIAAKEMRGEGSGHELRAAGATASGGASSAFSMSGAALAAPVSVAPRASATAGQGAGASAAALPNPGDPRDAIAGQARAFFASERDVQKTKFGGFAALLNLERAEAEGRCQRFVAGGFAPAATEGLDPPMILRMCRAWAYANDDHAAMRGLDQQLAASGDADAKSRLPLYTVAGY